MVAVVLTINRSKEKKTQEPFSWEIDRGCYGNRNAFATNKLSYK